jgi:hypothetical protein
VDIVPRRSKDRPLSVHSEALIEAEPKIIEQLRAEQLRAEELRAEQQLREEEQFKQEQQLKQGQQEFNNNTKISPEIQSRCLPFLPNLINVTKTTHW